ncbi:MAG: 3'(2'),5'-bisphosphate nucleotidase CysQ [Salegentibacter sp.]
MNALLKTAIAASIKAGKKILEIYEQEDYEIEKKKDDSPLTKADMAAHKIILSHLEETEIPVLSEEGQHLPHEKRKQWTRLWIVDPLDGTKEFIKRNGEFTVNIALVSAQKPVMGVIYIPVLQELYFAAEGIGSFKAENITDTSAIESLMRSAVRLPMDNKLDRYTVVASRSHLSQETKEYIDELKQKHGEVAILSKGSSLKLCMVAEGKADCYPRFGPTMEWDTAAGQAICTFAGKKVVDWETKEEMLYNRKQLRNGWFIVE